MGVEINIEPTEMQNGLGNERYRNLFARKFNIIGDRSTLFGAHSFRSGDGGGELIHTQSQRLRDGRKGQRW